MDKFIKNVVTPPEMRLAEKRCEEKYISCGRLMENAGFEVASEILKEASSGERIAILCGKGNNGGDGFAAARTLSKNGLICDIILACGKASTDLAKESFDRNIPYFNAVYDYTTQKSECERAISEADIIVDCIYGTGFHGNAEKSIAELLTLCNGTDAKRIAVDIPSCCNASDASVCECAFKADITLALGAIKTGEINAPCNRNCGEIRLLDIGIPDDCYEEKAIINDDTLFEKIKKTVRITNKGTFGRLLNISGSDYCIGAAWLSTNAAIRSGAGIVTLASTKNVISSVSSTLHECTFLPLKEADGRISSENIGTLIDTAKKCTAVSVGCGMGNSEETAKIVLSLINEVRCPIIIDADGINSLAPHINEITDNARHVLITPHIKEFSRISGMTVDEILSDKITAAKNFAKKYGINVLLKDAYSVIAAADGNLYVNMSGNSGLSKGGSGDTLTGTIGAFAAMGYTISESVRIGSYLLGCAAERAALTRHTLGILPSELPSLYAEILK